GYYNHHDLHSFPTRRSSDLQVGNVDLQPQVGKGTAYVDGGEPQHLFRLDRIAAHAQVRPQHDDWNVHAVQQVGEIVVELNSVNIDRKSTRLNSSHLVISYAV